MLSQWGFNHFKIPKKISKNIISFVGMSYGSRAKYKIFRKNNLNINVGARGWPKGRANNEKMLEIFQNSLINLNLQKVQIN